MRNAYLNVVVAVYKNLKISVLRPRVCHEEATYEDRCRSSWLVNTMRTVGNKSS